MRRSARLIVTADPLPRSDTTEVAAPTMSAARTASGEAVVEGGELAAGDISGRARWAAEPASEEPARTSAEATSAGPVERNQDMRGNSTAMPLNMERADKAKDAGTGRTTPVLPTIVADTDTRPLTLPGPSAAPTGATVSAPKSNAVAIDFRGNEGNPQSSMLSTLPKSIGGKAGDVSRFSLDQRARKLARRPLKSPRAGHGGYARKDENPQMQRAATCGKICRSARIHHRSGGKLREPGRRGYRARGRACYLMSRLPSARTLPPSSGRSWKVTRNRPARRSTPSGGSRATRSRRSGLGT